MSSKIQMTSDYIPKNPTSGWMRSELERIGVKNRGVAYTDSQLIKMLIEKGYDVSLKKAQEKEKPER